MTSTEVCYLTTTGRRTGRPHRIEIRREMDAKYHDTPPDRELTSWAQHSLVVRLTPAG